MFDQIIKRYQIQTLSAQIHREQGGAFERQCNCLRSQSGHSAFVDLFKNPDQHKAYYKGLQTCGSVYSCPICSVKITEHRKKEIETLLLKTSDYNHYMITLTIPHYIEESCKAIRQKFMLARRKFKKFTTLVRDPDWMPYSKFIKHHHVDGTVTTIEVTYGQNGWHIHSHELLILKTQAENLGEFRRIIYESWEKAVRLSKIKIKDYDSFYKRSVKVDHLQGDHKAIMTTYLTKIESSKTWGAAAELSKGNLKKSDNNNLTPFGMLHAINDARPEESKKLYAKYSLLFWEYCQAFKGKNFISFSKGLKLKYGIKDLTDQEIVDKDDPLKNFYGYFEITRWNEIKKARLRGWVIQNSDQDWEHLILKLIDKLKKGVTHGQTNFKKTG